MANGTKRRAKLAPIFRLTIGNDLMPRLGQSKPVAACLPAFLAAFNSIAPLVVPALQPLPALSLSSCS